jgi:hypothetical protein
MVDVADRSARYDRDVKVPRYAQAGIREVWSSTWSTIGCSCTAIQQATATRSCERSDAPRRPARFAFSDRSVGVDDILP